MDIDTIRFIANLAIACMGTVSENPDSPFKSSSFETRGRICSCTSIILSKSVTESQWRSIEGSKNKDWTLHQGLVSKIDKAIEACYKVMQQGNQRP